VRKLTDNIEKYQLQHEEKFHHVQLNKPNRCS